MTTSISEALLRCEDEPIRVPGSVQQHGFFLLVDARLEHVLAASENAQRFLNLPLGSICGAHLDALLGPELILVLQSMRGAEQKQLRAPLTYLGSFLIGVDEFSVLTHQIGVNRALEFEQQDRLVGPEMMNAVITNFVAMLEGLKNVQDLCHALTTQIAELTGFDRVMIYSFNQEGHGTVVSEVSNGVLPSYLGLRFPAADIPKQARELYLLNTTRIIPDAAYLPSPLVSATANLGSALDLSLSVLRSVSPIHLQYMQNMGTACSMSVSIVLEGKLWGLISCHGAMPKKVPYLIRSACDMLTKMAATHLASFQATLRLHEVLHFHGAQRDLLTILAGEQNYVTALQQQAQPLVKITHASGVAVLVDGQFSGAGLIPDNASLVRLAAWLDQNEDRQVFASSHLQSILPWTQSICDVASGLLAVRISSVRRRYILWFRPEVVSTVRWAGAPFKAQEANDQLTPRSSFDQWKEIVYGRSEPWTAMEVESATDFRTALITIGLNRAEEAMELSEARFQQLTQALPVKVFTADDTGQLTYVNQRWMENGLQTTGLWFEQALLCAEDLVASKALWQECIATGKSLEAEVRLQGASDGTERWNFARVIPFQRPGARRAGWIGTLMDLTESKQREIALRITEKLALTGRMTSVIAHEINNPLESITNLLYLLGGEINGNEAATNYIKQVENELNRISGITKQTLRWHRQSGQPEFFAFRPVVEDVLRMFSGKIGNRQLEFNLEDVNDTVCWGVLGQIRQVLVNLVSNAVDASQLGSSVTICVQQREGQVGFSVKDNGSGMSKEMQTRLFEPFYSTKGDLGNGLGLYISREILERHKGHMEVVSREQEGTTMTVWLPNRSH